jgi:hypothetical protein
MALIRPDYSSKESYLLWRRLRNWRRGQGPKMGFSAIDEGLYEWCLPISLLLPDNIPTCACLINNTDVCDYQSSTFYANLWHCGGLDTRILYLSWVNCASTVFAYPIIVYAFNNRRYITANVGGHLDVTYTDNLLLAVTVKLSADWSSDTSRRTIVDTPKHSIWKI